MHLHHQPTGPLVDPRLKYERDEHGDLLVFCELCLEWKREKQLALDPEDGQRWNVCAQCMDREERQEQAGHA